MPHLQESYSVLHLQDKYGVLFKNNVRLNIMNFSKTDETFGRAAVDELVRKSLLQKIKKSRKFLVWVFWGNMAFLLATAIICFWQLASFLGGDLSNPSLLILAPYVFGAICFSGVLGVFSIFGMVTADLRVKMLIMIGSLDQRMHHITQSERAAPLNGP